MFKIATWNINSIRMRLEHLRDFLKDENPDILLLQEIKCETEKFPYDELSDLHYNCYVHGQKTFNGVAVLSKLPADEVTIDFPSNPAINQSRFIEISLNTPIGFARIISLYAPNGGELGSDKFELKLEFYNALISYLVGKKSLDEKLIIGGDLNIAPFDLDMYSHEALRSSVCCTYEEQTKLRTILNNGFEDIYRLVNPNKKEFSWWDYRKGGFEHNHGLRIDFILASSNAAGDFKSCKIDYNMRSRVKPSDHAPVIAY